MGMSTCAACATPFNAKELMKLEGPDGKLMHGAIMIGDSVVQKPATMPWGNRSLLFRDPDGNLVNFFTPVSAEAINRLDK